MKIPGKKALSLSVLLLISFSGCGSSKTHEKNTGARAPDSQAEPILKFMRPNDRFVSGCERSLWREVVKGEANAFRVILAPISVYAKNDNNKKIKVVVSFEAPSEGLLLEWLNSQPNMAFTVDSILEKLNNKSIQEIKDTSIESAVLNEIKIEINSRLKSGKIDKVSFDEMSVF
jgi:hypothetical protein